MVTNSGLGNKKTVLYPCFVMFLDDYVGWGLFLGSKPVAKGSIVMEYVGEFVTDYESPYCFTIQARPCGHYKHASINISHDIYIYIMYMYIYIHTRRDLVDTTNTHPQKYIMMYTYTRRYKNAPVNDVFPPNFSSTLRRRPSTSTP